jgi:hypothetical protein
MPAKRIRSALRAWLYRKICYAEQEEMLLLLDRVVQDSQGLLLQLQMASDLSSQDTSAKTDLNAALKRAERLLEDLRNQAELHSQRSLARWEGRS